MTERMTNRNQSIIDDFSRFTDWESRYKHIIEVGKSLPPYPENFRTEDWKVKGCQSQVWLKPEVLVTGEVLFYADSDALIVKGLVSLLHQLYSGATPQEILDTPPDFIMKLDMNQHLSPSRSNGLHSMIKQIKYYAAAFQAVAGRQK